MTQPGLTADLPGAQASGGDGNPKLSVRGKYELACPTCHRDDCLKISAFIYVRPRADARAKRIGKHWWDKDSACICEACGYWDEVKFFDTSDANRREVQS